METESILLVPIRHMPWHRLAYPLAMRWHTEAHPLDVELSHEALRPLEAQQRDVGATLLVGHSHGACQEVVGVELKGWRPSFGFSLFHDSNGNPRHASW